MATLKGGTVGRIQHDAAPPTPDGTTTVTVTFTDPAETREFVFPPEPPELLVDFRFAKAGDDQVDVVVDDAATPPRIVRVTTG